MQAFLLLAIVGLLAQLVDGSMGMAYGATSSTLLLAMGFNPATASASVHLAEIGTTLMSGAAHWRFDNIDWRTVTRIAIPGAAGAFAGAFALTSVSTEIAEPWMAGILLSIGVYVLLRFSLGRTPQRRGRPYVRGRYLAPLGFVAGFVDATGGGGWGPIATPTLLATGKMAPRKVVGSVDTSEFLVALAASVGFLLSLGREGISATVVGALLLGGLIAAPLAAWLVRRMAPRLLGVGVGGLILVTNARTLLSTFHVPDGTRAPYYGVLVAVWAIAAVAALRWHRREDRAAWGEAGRAETVAETVASGG